MQFSSCNCERPGPGIAYDIQDDALIKTVEITVGKRKGCNGDVAQFTTTSS
jgi:hypothetical protein